MGWQSWEGGVVEAPLIATQPAPTIEEALAEGSTMVLSYRPWAVLTSSLAAQAEQQTSCARPSSRPSASTTRYTSARIGTGVFTHQTRFEAKRS